MIEDGAAGSPDVTVADILALIERTLTLREGITPGEVEAIAGRLHSAAIDALGALDPVGAARDRRRLAARWAALDDDEMAARWRGPEGERFLFFRAEVLEAAWSLGLDTDRPVGEWLRAALDAVARGEPVAPTAAMIAHAEAIGAKIETGRPWRSEGRGRPASDHAAALADALAVAYRALTGRPAGAWTGDGRDDPATLRPGSFKAFCAEFCDCFGIRIEASRTLARK